ncbi:hypothetical protein [Spirosoma litoris]
MNLNQNPTRDQLKLLLAECDNTRRSHLLYVKSDGDVRIKSFLNYRSYAEWVDDNPDDILLRFEHYDKGQNYVGPVAAQNEPWIERLYNALLDNWSTKNLIYPDYIDFY